MGGTRTELSSGVLFLPTQMTGDCTSMMEESLDALRTLTKKEVLDETGPLSNVYKLRQLTIKTSADSGHKDCLKVNTELSYGNKMLTNIYDKVNEVCLKLDNGDLRFELVAGKSRDCSNGKGTQWNICLKEEKHYSVCVNNITSLKLFVSGVELRVKSYHYDDLQFAIVFENRVRLFGEIKKLVSGGNNPYDPDVTHDDVDLRLDSFRRDLYDELNNPPSIAFPHLFLWFDNLWFDYKNVKKALELLVHARGSSKYGCGEKEDDDCCRVGTDDTNGVNTMEDTRAILLNTE